MLNVEWRDNHRGTCSHGWRFCARTWRCKRGGANLGGFQDEGMRCTVGGLTRLFA